MSSAVAEIKEGKRFQFGKNWTHFLAVLDEDRIAQAEDSLSAMLGMARLDGKRFLDVGSGSGLFSLAARRLGACVHSLDYDPQSVACTLELKIRYFPIDPMWIVEEGSALDSAYLSALGKHHIVYSWGVLHHTGQMWKALENVASLVEVGGALFISIYNDQGDVSRRWTSVKRMYNRSPRAIQILLVLGIGSFFGIRSILRRLFGLQNPLPAITRKRTRGMSTWHDLVDWVGGYPFEVAKPEKILDFFHPRGFELIKLKTCGGYLGCNEFLFVKKQ